MIKRRTAFYGQQRLDVPLFRAAESSVSNDFDVLVGKMLAGGRPLVVSGFSLTNSALPVDPTTLQLLPAGGALCHATSSEPGTIFSVKEDAGPETLSITNARVRGSFMASSTNYVGIDLVRAVDDTTIDVQKFLDATSLQEISESVALAITLDYVITISTLEFSVTPSVCPIAVITTDGSGNATAITDARNMLGRLSSGGSSPSAVGTATWAQGRTEGATSFTGGDKATSSLKGALDAMMYRLWEIGGGQQWFSACTDRDLKVTYGSAVLGNGDNFSFNSGTSTLTWSGLNATFANSPVSSNGIADGSAVLADGQCLYVDIDRTAIHDGSGAGPLAKLVPAVGTLTLLGSPSTPGSRMVLAWRLGSLVYAKDRPYEVGRTFIAATSLALGIVKLSLEAPADSLNPKVVPLDANGTVTHTATAGSFPAFAGTGGGGNSDGVQGTGTGTGAGIHGISLAGTGPGVKGDSTGGHGAVFTALSGNKDGVQGTGIGSGAGLRGTAGTTGTGVLGFGGNTNGTYGVAGTSLATNGNGVLGQATGTGTGVEGQAGGASGIAVLGTGGAGIGVKGTASGANSAVIGDASAGTGAGVVGSAGGASVGVQGTGGPTNGIGVNGIGQGAGTGVQGRGGATGGTGLVGFGGVGNGDAVLGVANGTGSAFRSSVGPFTCATPVDIGKSTEKFNRAHLAAPAIYSQVVDPTTGGNAVNEIHQVNLPVCQISFAAAVGVATPARRWNATVSRVGVGIYAVAPDISLHSSCAMHVQLRCQIDPTAAEVSKYDIMSEFSGGVIRIKIVNRIGAAFEDPVDRLTNPFLVDVIVVGSPDTFL